MRSLLARSLPGLVILAASPAMAGSPAEGLQSRQAFATAVSRLSTMPSYVMITVVDGRTGAERTGCVVAPFLLGAILKERHINVSDASLARAMRIAAAAPRHRFTFRNDVALRAVSFDDPLHRNEEACRLIRNGRVAMMADRSGQVFDATDQAGG